MFETKINVQPDGRVKNIIEISFIFYKPRKAVYAFDSNRFKISTRGN
jgi:hypothetical protein